MRQQAVSQRFSCGRLAVVRMGSWGRHVVSGTSQAVLGAWKIVGGS